MRAVPALILPDSAAAGSCVFTRPMRGSITWDPSSTRIAPVVNRHDTRARRRDLKQGKPVFGPRRFPAGASQHSYEHMFADSG